MAGVSFRRCSSVVSASGAGAGAAGLATGAATDLAGVFAAGLSVLGGSFGAAVTTCGGGAGAAAGAGGITTGCGVTMAGGVGGGAGDVSATAGAGTGTSESGGAGAGDAITALSSAGDGRITLQPAACSRNSNPMMCAACIKVMSEMTVSVHCSLNAQGKSAVVVVWNTPPRQGSPARAFQYHVPLIMTAPKP